MLLKLYKNVARRSHILIFFYSPLLIPDAFGVLIHSGVVVYNDAPWLENISLVGRHYVHPCTNNDLAERLGVQSVHCLSLVSEDMTKNLLCMDYNKISELLALYRNNEVLLFDLLELADCCKAKKLHLVYDKRETSSPVFASSQFR